MLTAFAITENRLSQVQIKGPQDLSADLVWIDLIDPSEEERCWVEERYHQQLPTTEEMEEIEATARFYEDEDGLHIHSYFMHDYEERARNITVAFTLNNDRLFTVHEEDLVTFRMYRMRARREPGLARDATSILLTLFETKVERLADVLEQVYSDLEAVSQSVLTREQQNSQETLEQLAIQEDVNGKARLSLMDKQRVLSFLLRSGRLSGDQSQVLREILRDIDSLMTHTSFLFEKVNFLMDAVLGFINIEQNQIIKIFSIAAVVFLPPTLIASIYGMNFDLIPELDWSFGYPWALGLMVLSAYMPYWYFKRKGWL
ncbi:MAG TPA: magnesium/cobalt transporter CorA [Gammaproteobacteria bacterium]|nr:magnesium/cobalt transporter CorA [Gammaproteobacteria bacterium]